MRERREGGGRGRMMVWPLCHVYQPRCVTSGSYCGKEEEKEGEYCGNSEGIYSVIVIMSGRDKFGLLCIQLIP